MADGISNTNLMNLLLYYYKDGINDWDHCIMDYQSTQICRNENVHAKNKQLQLNEDGVIYGPYAIWKEEITA